MVATNNLPKAEPARPTFKDKPAAAPVPAAPKTKPRNKLPALRPMYPRGDAYALLRDARKECAELRDQLHKQSITLDHTIIANEEAYASLIENRNDWQRRAVVAELNLDRARLWSALWKRSAKMDRAALRNLENQVQALREHLNSLGIYDISVMAGLHSLADRAHRAEESAKSADVLPTDQSPIMALMKAQRERDTAIRERDALQEQSAALREALERAEKRALTSEESYRKLTRETEHDKQRIAVKSSHPEGAEG